MDTGSKIAQNTAPCPYLAVVVPAYNEEVRLASTLDALLNYYAEQTYSWTVTVVSDGSSDKTVALAESMSAKDARFRVISYSPNRGKGFAVRKGMLEVEGEILLFCDADLATPQQETQKLLDHIVKGADVAIGSRPLKGSHLVVRQPVMREMMGRAFNLVVRALAVPGIYDTQCGFKMFKKEAAQAVFSRCSLDGFSFDFEAIMVARDLGLKVEEVPIEWSHQAGSKVSMLRDGPKMVFDLLKTRLKGKRARVKVKQASSS